MFSLTDHEIYIVTARHEERENGQIATWIMPATLVPDRLRIAAILSPQHYTASLIRQSGRFTVNLLAEGQHELVPLFGLVSGRDIDKFDGMELLRTRNGLPVIPGACGWAECAVVSSLDSGDRVVYLADVAEHSVDMTKIPLRKREAFARLDPDVRELLEEKQRRDGERDRALSKLFISTAS
jgi:flavin reductase (DIM6/NTAB) family NADH-FMN oxidoreductase RutF